MPLIGDIPARVRVTVFCPKAVEHAIVSSAVSVTPNFRNWFVVWFVIVGFTAGPANINETGVRVSPTLLQIKTDNGDKPVQIQGLGRKKDLAVAAV